MCTDGCSFFFPHTHVCVSIIIVCPTFFTRTLWHKHTNIHTKERQCYYFLCFFFVSASSNEVEFDCIRFQANECDWTAHEKFPHFFRSVPFAFFLLATARVALDIKLCHKELNWNKHMSFELHHFLLAFFFSFVSINAISIHDLCCDKLFKCAKEENKNDWKTKWIIIECSFICFWHQHLKRVMMIIDNQKKNGKNWNISTSNGTKTLVG